MHPLFSTDSLHFLSLRCLAEVMGVAVIEGVEGADDAPLSSKDGC